MNAGLTIKVITAVALTIVLAPWVFVAGVAIPYLVLGGLPVWALALVAVFTGLMTFGTIWEKLGEMVKEAKGE